MSFTITFMIVAVLQVAIGAPTGQSTPTASTPNPTQFTTLQLYYHMNLEMDELRRNHKTTYDEYKTDRFSDPDIYVPSMELDGIPDLSDLTMADRFAMNESDLLQLHRSSLQAYGQLMVFVTMDETLSNSPKDFGPQFGIISARIARIVANIEALMQHLGYFQNGFPTTSPVTMAPENSVFLRNIRDLYVLQEMFNYLALADYDLRRWFTIHAHAFSQ